MKKLPVKRFAKEVNEARWWDANKDIVAKNLVAAMKSGIARRVIRERRESKNKRCTRRTAFTAETPENAEKSSGAGVSSLRLCGECYPRRVALGRQSFSYAKRRRSRPPRASKPVPNRASVPGSGVGPPPANPVKVVPFRVPVT